MSGSGISWAICKSTPCSRQTTTPVPHHSVFYRPDALPAAQPTASKHWRHKLLVKLLLSKYAIERWFNFPPHLFRVYTLPCKTSHLFPSFFPLLTSILKFCILTANRAMRPVLQQHAKYHQNRSRLRRYGDLTVFKMVAVRHLGFLKFKFVNGQDR